MNHFFKAMSVTKLFLAAMFVLLWNCSALAQDAALGNIAGTIRDSSGALIAGATVVVRNNGTNATRTVLTDSQGHYAATFLQPGQYEILLGGGSFGKVDQKSVSVTVGSTVTVDATLAAAGVSTEIVVSDRAPLIETEKTDVSQVVDQTLVSNLPVNGRRYDNFVLLTPNVVPDGSTGLLSFRGISGLYNTNLIDGANNQNAFFSEARARSSGAPYVFSQDSIKEFQASASGYSAEFGQAAGGQINAITRSGTNAIHGDLFYYLRYPSLNALDPYSKYTGRLNNNPVLLQPTIHQQQQFGGSVGGPLLKEKLFGFFTYDGFRKVSPILYSSSIPSATVNAYACPAAISATQCTNAKNYILGLSAAVPRTLKQDIFFPRIDYQLNGNNHISAEFNFMNFHYPNSYTAGPTVSNNSVSANGTSDYHERIFVANWESVLSSSLANVARFQWGRDLEVTSGNASGPNVTISGLQAYGLPNGLPRGAFPDEHRVQFSDTLSKTKGRHTVKGGVDVNLIHDHIQNLFQGGGLYSYQAYAGQTQTGAAGAFYNWVQDVYGANGGQHYFSFLQTTDAVTGKGIDDFWNKNVAAFIADTWKVRSNVTLDAGVRYDLQLIPQPTHPYTNSYNGVPSPLGNSVTNSININYKMIQPRIGFAWTPHEGTVVRGGYGIFYGLSSNSTFYATRAENGVLQQLYQFFGTVTAPNAAVPYTYIAGAPSNTGVLFAPPGPALSAPFAGAVTPTVQGGAAGQKLAFRGQDSRFTNPYTHSMDLAVEQELPGHLTLGLSYVGTRGMRLPYFIDANLPQTTLTRTYTVTNSNGSISQVTVPFYSNTLARPSPNDGPILVGYSGINSWYHSGVATIRKPFSHGLELLVNYTWAKTMDGDQVAGQFGTFNGTNTILDPNNLKRSSNPLSEYSRSDLDMRGRFVGSVVWSPKVAFGFAPARYVLNNWSISGTATEQTGLPLTQTMSTSPAGGLDGGVTGAAVGNSPSAATGRAPQIRRNSTPGPGIRNVDARVSREFPIHDAIRFQIFTEVFNVANRRQVIGQSTTAYQAGSLYTTGPYAGTYAITPYTSTPFGFVNSTSGTLYGPRQLQFTAKLFF